MNKVWSYIFIISIIVSIYNGKIQDVVSVMFEATSTAIEMGLNIFRNTLPMVRIYEDC